MKRIALLMAAVLCALCLSGCVPLSVDLQRTDEEVSLPAPAVQSVESAVGDSQSAVKYEVDLYLISDDYQLVSVRRSVETVEGESLAEAAVNALLSERDAPGLLNPFPDGTALLGMERSGNAAVVDLSIEALGVENEHQFLWMRSALAATLIGLEDIQYVNVLVAGRAEALMALPAGAASGAGSNLVSAAARLSADHELLEHHDGDAVSLERNAVIYYAAQGGEYIVPVVRSVRITSDDFVTPLLEALAAQPGEDWLFSPFPQFSSALIQEPEIVETENGEKLVRLAFDANLMASLEREGLSQWQLCAALTYTVTGFVPEIDALVIQLGDGQLTRTERGGKEISFPDGEMCREDYPDAVGRGVCAYMTSSEGGLVRLYRPLDQKSASSPRALLAQLFDGVRAWETGASRVMPDGVSIDDVLGICIAEGEAVVNLSSNFYRCCQSLTPQQERNLIYAVVNSLTELATVSSVRFQVEGEAVDYLVSEVYLRGALLRNIGIIK